MHLFIFGKIPCPVRLFHTVRLLDSPEYSAWIFKIELSNVIIGSEKGEIICLIVIVTFNEPYRC